MNVFDLFAKLSLDKSEYEEGLDDAEKDADSFGSKLKGGLSTATKVATGAIAAVGTASVALGKSFVNNMGDVASFGDNIDKMSQKIGISAEAYQEWDFIAQHSGTSMESLKASFKTLSTAAQGGAEEFEALGISLEDAASMSTEDLFSSVISGLQNMEEGTERTALASKLLGKGAVELGALLNTSAEDTEAMRQEVHDLGGVMSNDAVKAAAQYQDSLQNMQTAMTGLKNNMMSEFLPAASEVMDGLAKVFSGDDMGMESIDAGIDNLITSLTDTLPKVMEIGGSIVESLSKSIITNLPKLAKTAADIVLSLGKSLIEELPLLIESGLQIIMELALAIGQALPDLIPTIIDVILQIVDTLLDNIDMLVEGAIAIILGLAEGLINALPILIEKIPEIITSIIDALIENLPLLIDGAIQLVTMLVVHLPEIIMALIQAIPEIIMAIVDAFGPLVESLGGVITDAVENIKNIFTNLWSAIQSTFSGVGNFFKNAFTKAWNAVKSVFSNWGAFFGNLWNTISNKFKAIGTNIANAISGAVKSGINGVISAIENIINKGIGLINGAIDLINKLPGVSIDHLADLQLPRLAKGGVVNRSMIAEIGENGAEAVVPLERNTGWIRNLAEELQRIINENPTNASQNTQPIVIENHIYLEGEAKGVFKLVREQNNINTRVTGRNALATS